MKHNYDRMSLTQLQHKCGLEGLLDDDGNISDRDELVHRLTESKIRTSAQRRRYEAAAKAAEVESKLVQKERKRVQELGTNIELYAKEAVKYDNAGQHAAAAEYYAKAASALRIYAQKVKPEQRQKYEINAAKYSAHSIKLKAKAEKERGRQRSPPRKRAKQSQPSDPFAFGE